MDHRFSGTASRYRIGVAMYELPLALFGTEDTRHAQGHGNRLLASCDLRFEPLYLEYVCEFRGYAFREVLELHRSAITIVGGSPPAGLFDLSPTARRRAIRVREGGVFTVAEQIDEATAIASRDLIQRFVAPFNYSLEILRRSHALPPRFEEVGCETYNSTAPFVQVP